MSQHSISECHKVQAVQTQLSWHIRLVFIKQYTLPTFCHQSFSHIHPNYAGSLQCIQLTHQRTETFPQSASFSCCSPRTKGNDRKWDDRENFHPRLFISVAAEMGCLKSLATFYQTVTFNTFNPHECTLFWERKTKIPFNSSPALPCQHLLHTDINHTYASPTAR